MAFHSLRIDGSHGQRTSDLAPASERSVTVSAPARIISVPVSAPARVHSVPVGSPRRPEASDARFSAPGFPQDDTTVEVDIRNRSVRLVTALEESTNILLVNTHSPRKFIVSRRSQDQYQY